MLDFILVLPKKWKIFNKRQNSKKNRKCAFLDNRLCRIYEVRPIQCKRTPYNFFAYKKLWEYMPCVDNEKYIDGQSYNEDIELIRELLKGY